MILWLCGFLQIWIFPSAISAKNKFSIHYNMTLEDQYVTFMPHTFSVYLANSPKDKNEMILKYNYDIYWVAVDDTIYEFTEMQDKYEINGGSKPSHEINLYPKETDHSSKLNAKFNGSTMIFKENVAELVWSQVNRTDDTWLNLTSKPFMSGKINVVQDDTKIDKYVDTSKLVTLNLDLMPIKKKYLQENTNTLTVYWYDNCELFNETALVELENLTFADAEISHNIYAVLKFEAEGQEPSEPSDLKPFKCEENKINLSGIQVMAYGKFFCNFYTIEPISIMTITGKTKNLREFGAVKLKAKYNGTKPFQYCFLEFRGKRDITGDENCDKKLSTEKNVILYKGTAKYDSTIVFIVSNPISIIRNSTFISLHKGKIYRLFCHC